ncbi:MFS transporter [Haloarcula salina]|uniref:MFS transporter n=1 Tax=Haloarcula salina TaxID=1429914 RepID=A0AA41KD54_9EURY|nr:MFS transporter [Haloarcula salina]MBV0903175.1 MFS transporter [Haloarcula salina]
MTESRAPWGLRAAPHLAVFGMGYVMFGYAGVPAYFLGRYGIDYAAFGLLMSATLLPFVLVQWPASRLVERTTSTRLLLWTTATQAVLALTLDFAPTYGTLLGLRFLWGVAAGVLLSVGATHVARLYEGTTASRQQGFYGGMLTLGGATGFLAAPQFVTVTAGAGVHALGALLAVPAFGALWLHRSDRRTAPTSTEPDVSPLSVVTDRRVLLASLCYVAIISSYMTLSTFVTAYFEELGVLGPLNALVLGTASVGRGLGGSAVFWLPLDDEGVIGGSTGVAFAGFLLLAGGSSGLLLVGLPFVVMLAVSVPFGAVYNVAASATNAEGTALATVVALGNVAALAFPPITGAVRDVTGGYDGAFVLLGALNALAVVAAVTLARRSR